MFESALVESQRRPRSKKRFLFVPVAIVIHVLGLSGFVFAQYWQLELVPEPEIMSTFVQIAAPPPPPPPPPPPKAAAPKPTTPTPVVIAPPDVPVQPVTVPDNLPPPTTGSGDDSGAEGGVEGGVEGGIEGGVVGSDVGGNEILRVGGAIDAPVAISRVSPVYTEIARKARLQGVVVLEAIIDTSGNVTQVRILKGLPMGLDKSAEEAVKKWKFKPATLNGRPVKVYFNLTVNFRLQ